MNIVSQAAMHAYILSTGRLRKGLRHRLAAEGRAPICLLFYHRVADQHPNDWTISTSSFARQMKWLQRHADMISLPEAQQRLQQGNDRLAVSVTFDDGYADNCDFALPLLAQENIPCTYFVSLDFIMTGRPFPHDVRAGIPLRPNTPEQLRQIAGAGIEIGGHTRHHTDLGSVADELSLWDEVVTSAAELAELVQQPVRYFAFPFGKPQNLNPRAVMMARNAGFLGMVSAFGGYNMPHRSEQTFYLRRIHGDPQFSRLKNWITLDPRKLNTVHNDQEIVNAASRGVESVTP